MLGLFQAISNTLHYLHLHYLFTLSPVCEEEMHFIVLNVYLSKSDSKLLCYQKRARERGQINVDLHQRVDFTKAQRVTVYKTYSDFFFLLFLCL